MNHLGTVLFQIFLWLAVCGLALVAAMELVTDRFRRQYHKGKWVLALMDRGYLRRIL